MTAVSGNEGKVSGGDKNIAIFGSFIFAMIIFAFQNNDKDMLRHKRMLAVCTLLLTAVAVVAQVRVEKGVSQQLAQQRAADISDVAYELTMRIPSAKTENVVGTAVIKFNWRGSSDLQIDFQGKRIGDSLAVWSDGKEKGVLLKPVYSDEHIIVPKQYLREGRNAITLSFVSDDNALNRSDDYMYTLFVPDHARSVFPCFDQPDIKARFSLALTVPKGWKAMSNGQCNNVAEQGDGVRMAFDNTYPLPTYLFSFVAGQFAEAKTTADGREMTAFYRETDKDKIAQLPAIFGEAAHSLRWMEQYTGIRYPFQKYAFVILSGYQFGGMEHPGCIQFNDRTIFLSQNPTPDERLARMNLIAHETAHMWFGDLVTMQWFNDVWTKEVFANFMADKISREMFPDINHDLLFLKAHHAAAMAVDRTDGTHPIQQPLDNLCRASMLYGNIIYHKAPIVMQMLEQQMGPEQLQKGLQEYLDAYKYGTSSWDKLIVILDKKAPFARLNDFDNVWVKQRGMPLFTYSFDGQNLVLRQSDAYNRGLVWPQTVKMGLFDEVKGQFDVIDVVSDKSEVRVPVAKKPYAILPNYDGSAYGRFMLDSLGIAMSTYSWQLMEEGVNRFAAIENLHENYLAGRIAASNYLLSLNTYLMNEADPLLCSVICSDITSACNDLKTDERDYMEYYLMNDATSHQLTSVRQQMMRYLSLTVTSSVVADDIYQLWLNKTDSLLTPDDYTAMAYHLAVIMPDKWQDILTTERKRITQPDKLRAFDYISRACAPDLLSQSELFRSLLKAENRSVEPWARDMLALLCDPLREQMANSYIDEGLNALSEIQQTGDIFFPGYWIRALLGGHHSQQALQKVEQWIASKPDCPEPLVNQVRQVIYTMKRRAARN